MKPLSFVGPLTPHDGAFTAHVFDCDKATYVHAEIRVSAKVSASGSVEWAAFTTWRCAGACGQHPVKGRYVSPETALAAALDDCPRATV
jgi:hypothetical protein